MAIVSVEIPDEIAKNFQSSSVISFEDFKKQAYEEDEGYVRLIDFGPKGIGEKEWKEYLNTK